MRRKPWIYVVLNIEGVEKYARKTCDCGQSSRPFDSSFERKGASVKVEICVFCSW